MSVIISKMDRTTSHDRKRTCFECDREIHHYPFLEWNSLFICPQCCRRIQKGLMADMVHGAAIHDLHRLGYSGETFERKTVKQVEEDERKQIAVENAALIDFRNRS